MLRKVVWVQPSVWAAFMKLSVSSIRKTFPHSIILNSLTLSMLINQQIWGVTKWPIRFCHSLFQPIMWLLSNFKSPLLSSAVSHHSVKCETPLHPKLLQSSAGSSSPCLYPQAPPVSRPRGGVLSYVLLHPPRILMTSHSGLKRQKTYNTHITFSVNKSLLNCWIKVSPDWTVHIKLIDKLLSLDMKWRKTFINYSPKFGHIGSIPCVCFKLKRLVKCPNINIEKIKRKFHWHLIFHPSCFETYTGLCSSSVFSPEEVHVGK